MEHLKIVINSVEDAKSGKPIVEGLLGEDVTETKDVTCAILENGTASGATSLMFIARTSDGKAVMFQLTQGLLDGLNGALKGAVERFGR